MATRDVLIGVLCCVATLVASVPLSMPLEGTGPPPETLLVVGKAHSLKVMQQGTPTPQHAQWAETLLVFPFENYSRMAKLDWVGEGLSELTIERLSDAGEFVFLREERMATVEKMGLPASQRYSRATMLKIAEEIDADYIVFGRYTSDGKTLTVTAEILHVDPLRLSPPIEETGALESLMDLHARLAWRILTAPDPAYPLSQRDLAKKFSVRRQDAFEFYIRGLVSVDDDQRLRNFKEAARLEPAWDEPAFALGQMYYMKRDCDSAVPWLARVPSSHDRGFEAAFYTGVCHLLRSEPVGAEVAFANLLARLRARSGTSGGATPKAGAHAADLPEVVNNLAIAKARAGKTREAIAGFERAAQLDPDEPDYWFNWGLVELRANDPIPATKPLREAVRLQPDNAEARMLLVAALEASGRGPEAAGEREALKRLPASRGTTGSATAPAWAGLDRIKTHLDVASLRAFPEAAAQPAAEATPHIAHRAQHTQFHLTRGRQFLAGGKLDEAQREFTEAAVVAPRDIAAHQGLAEIHRRRGRLDDAVRELRAALAIRDNAASHIALARVFIQKNLGAQARDELRLALKLEPTSAEARQLLDLLESRGGPGAPR